MLVPVAFKDYDSKREVTVLAGDIGGTKINIALYRADENGFTILRQDSFHSKEYTSFTAIVQKFIGNDKTPDAICMAVAGPVINGKVKITNLSWQLDSNDVSKELGRKVIFINDLEANAYGLAGLKSDELYNLSEGDPKQEVIWQYLRQAQAW